MDSPGTSEKESPSSRDPAAGAEARDSSRPFLHPAVRFIAVLIAFVAVVAGISTPPGSPELRVHWNPNPGPLWVFGMPLFTWLAGGFWVVRGTAAWRNPARQWPQYAVIAGIMAMLGLFILAGTLFWALTMALGPVR